MDNIKKSILEMARGAFLEMTDYEVSRVMDNILDPNTKATAKRKITLTMELIPDDTRINIAVRFTPKSTLAPSNPVVTNLYVTGADGTGEVQVVEMVPQIPGQYTIEGAEQEAPAMLKLIKC